MGIDLKMIDRLGYSSSGLLPVYGQSGSWAPLGLGIAIGGEGPGGIAGDVGVTRAPGTAASCASLTVPRMVPEAV